MTHEDNPQPSLETLDRFLAGECSDDEYLKIQQWIRADKRNDDIIASLRVVPVTHTQRDFQADEVSAAFKRFKKAYLHPRPSPSSRRGEWMRFAGSGRSYRAMFLGAAVMVFGVGIGGKILTDLFKTSDAATSVSSERIYSTGKGQRITVQLPEGSRVTLGPETRMVLKSAFSELAREITVEGAAYFEVTANPTSPMLVRTSSAIAQVIGTAFSVVQYPGDSVAKVVVEQGKVAVRATNMEGLQHSEKPLVLTRSEMSEVVASQSPSYLSDVDLAEELAWVSGQLHFRSMSVRDIARVLERWYDVELMIPDSRIANKKLTASFGREGIIDILAQLCSAIDARYQVHNKTIVILDAPR